MIHNNPLKRIIISNRLNREEKTGIPTELGAWPVEETSWYLPGIIGIIISIITIITIIAIIITITIFTIKPSGTLAANPREGRPITSTSPSSQRMRR